MNHIDKEILHFPEITKRLRPLSIWYWVFAALGAGLTLLYLLLTDTSSTAAAMLLMGVVIGDFCLVVVVCYYLFGDCRGVYHKATRQFLEREIDFYPQSAQQALQAAFESNDFSALEAVKRAPTSNLALISYISDDRTIVYCQLVISHDTSEQPLTGIMQK